MVLRRVIPFLILTILLPFSYSPCLCETEIKVVINELFYDPYDDEVFGEFVELYNARDGVEITDWKITDQDSSAYDFIFPKFYFPSNTYIVIHTCSGENETDLSDNAANFYIGKKSSIWTNTGDDVLLVDNNGKGIDYIVYGNGTAIDLPPKELVWQNNAPIAKEGKSIALIPNGMDLDSGKNWYQSIPSPGKENMVSNENPKISIISQMPLNPMPNENVEIKVKVEEDYGIGNVTLYYSINDREWLNIKMEKDDENFSASLLGLIDGSALKYYAVAEDIFGAKNRTEIYSYLVSSEKVSVLINEFYPTSEEWIELYNNGNRKVQIGGWYIDDAPNGSKPYKIPFGRTIEPKGYAIFFSNETKIALNDDGDEVRLLDDSFKLLDNYTYTSVKENNSIARIPDGSSNWKYLYYPTPNETNNIYKDYGKKILITEVYYHPYPKDDDEFIRIYNPNDEDVEISGWVLSNGKKFMCFPIGSILKAKEYAYISSNSTTFYERAGFQSNYAIDIEKKMIGGWITLSNEGGIVLLKDYFDNDIDMVAYIINYTGNGWIGDGVKASSTGYILKRKLEKYGYNDTNTSKDWDNIKKYRLGQSEQKIESYTSVGEVIAFVSPDSSYNALVNEIDNAKQSIHVNLYEFGNWHIAEKLINALKRGVKVKVFLDGKPFGGISNSEKYITNELVNNGADVGFLISNVSAGIYYRYKVNHAKYALIDNETTIITTANWKLSGIPVNPSYGNREWGILIRNRNLTNYFLNVFEDDFKVGMKDVFLFNSSDLKYGSPTTGFEIDREVPKGKYKPKFSSAEISGKFKFTPIISPDNSLELMTELLKNANESIYLEMATISMSWNYKDDKLENVYLNALIEAARRGCKVRVLLDSRFVDIGMEIVDNKDVADYVNMIGENERLDIEAKVVKLENLEKLHTKGIIVDGKITLISSINWVRGSAIMNREAGVIIENEELASYYSSVFLYDWEEKGIEKEEKKITEITYNYLFLLTPLVVTIIIILWALREKKK